MILSLANTFLWQKNIVFAWTISYAFESFIENWMDRWFMVFDKPPHNNGGGPIVFPQKNICWIVLGLHVNNFDIVELQIVGFDFA